MINERRGLCCEISTHDFRRSLHQRKLSKQEVLQTAPPPLNLPLSDAELTRSHV